MTVEHHPPLEEYVAALYELEEERIPLIRARLADRLGHSAPTVTEMVGRLKAEGLVEGGRELALTTKGRRAAEGVVRKHRLAERLLTDVIGLEWHKAHLEAGRWEHVISDEVEGRLVELLADPATCPHGNPIPGSRSKPPKGQRPLASAGVGDTARLQRVTETIEIDTETLAYLDAHGLRPGVLLKVVAKSPDGSLMIETDEGAVALSTAVASRIYVTTG